MDDARQWLQEHGVPLLMEKGLKALVDEKPEDPVLFLANFYARVHREQTVVRPVARKAKSVKIEINVSEETPEKINAGSLASIVRSDTRSVKIVDVRHSIVGGHIKGAVHIPSHDILPNAAELAKQWATECEALVFTSAQSPDLDQLAATAVMQALREQSCNMQVYVLSGGFIGWLHYYKQDPALTESYDPAVWEATDTGAGVPRENAVKKALHDAQVTNCHNETQARRWSAKGLHVSVPDPPPEGISLSALAVLIEQCQGTLVVDVRLDPVCSIVSSVQLSAEGIAANASTYAEQWKHLNTIVIISSVSPDLDLTAAVPLQHALRDIGSETMVLIASNGMKGFINQFGKDPKLVENYDEVAWGKQNSTSADELSSSPTAGDSQATSSTQGQRPSAAGNGRAPPKNGGKAHKKAMTVAVPDAPSILTKAELVAIMQAVPQTASPRRSRFIIVDVREPEELKCGTLRGSIHIPSRDILADVPKYAAMLKEYSLVCFASTASPDLDEACAVPMMLCLRELQADTEVFILMQGIKSCYDNPMLMVGFNPGEARLRRQSVDLACPAPAPVAAKKRHNVLDLHIGIPESAQKLPPQQLALLINSGCHDSFAVVDVREGPGGKASGRSARIANAVAIPHSEVTQDPASLAAQWADKDSVVFVSTQSPDLDATAASSVLTALRDIGSNAQVFILHGGMVAWQSLYGGDPKLTVTTD